MFKTQHSARHRGSGGHAVAMTVFIILLGTRWMGGAAGRREAKSEVSDPHGGRAGVPASETRSIPQPGPSAIFPVVPKSWGSCPFPCLHLLCPAVPQQGLLWRLKCSLSGRIKHKFRIFLTPLVVSDRVPSVWEVPVSGRCGKREACSESDIRSPSLFPSPRAGSV